MHDFSFRHRIPVLLTLLTLGGCAPRPDAGSAGQAASETRLAVDVPAGLAIRVDGMLQGVAPLDPLVVAPGTRLIELEGPCEKVSASVEAAAGALTTVTAQEFAGLKLAQLSVIARTPERQPADVSVFLGDWKVPGAAVQPTTIPACKLRLRVVAPEGLGGFMEDIEFEAGKSYVRELSLAPGSDMVRIAGARFRIGPPGPDHYDPNFDYEEVYEEFEGWPYIKTYEVDIATFDIDRVPVTAEQFHACYKAGFCGDEPVLAGGTRGPSRWGREECSIDNYETMRDPRPGRGNHPANCVAGWEAKKYCEWVGKRLPTDVEWEFAARSRNPEYACPWGSVQSRKVKCDRSPTTPHKEGREVCSYPSDNTEQGLCDMVGIFAELVTHAAVPGRPPPSDCKFNTRSQGGNWSFDGYDGCLDMQQSTHRGFRCARDVGAAPAQG